jgi:hypothetical protein
MPEHSKNAALQESQFIGGFPSFYHFPDAVTAILKFYPSIFTMFLLNLVGSLWS